MRELTLQALWGSPLVLLLATTLLAQVVTQRLATLRGQRGTGSREQIRMNMLRRAMAAACFGIAGSALCTLISGASILFRFDGLMPQAAMQGVVTLSVMVCAALLALETGESADAMMRDPNESLD